MTFLDKKKRPILCGICLEPDYLIFLFLSDKRELLYTFKRTHHHFRKLPYFNQQLGFFELILISFYRMKNKSEIPILIWSLYIRKQGMLGIL